MVTQTDRGRGLTGQLGVKAPVVVATTAAITLVGTQTIDGVAVVAEDRVLVKDQTDTTTNGIYICQVSTWLRAPDFDGDRDILQGTWVPAALGSTNLGSIFRVTTANPIVIGTSAITFDVATTTGAVTSAAASAATATTQASNASTSASNASTSASAASTSASNASSSASTASTQASNASTSASTASTQASNASASAAAAAASYDSFDDRYLGAKGSGPATDNDGEALLTGALYWDTGTNLLMIWDGSAWVDSNSADAKTANPLSQFAATTSAQLAGVISNETGSGALVFGTSPTIATPDIDGGTIDNTTIGASTPGAITGTSITATGTLSGASLTVTKSDDPANHYHNLDSNATAARTWRFPDASDISVGLDTTDTLTNKTLTTPTINGGTINEDVHTEAAHATTSDIWTGGNTCLLSGSAVTFTDVVDAPAAGAVRYVVANAAHILTDNANLEVDGNSNYTCAIGDLLRFEAKTTSTFRVSIVAHGDGAGSGNAQTANGLDQFAATTSAELAGVISDETGSGALVFAESPTLVTPALGTPASGVATNLTGTASGLTAGKASNIAGGAGGQIPYQSSANTTALLSNGSDGQVLTSTGGTSAPAWETTGDALTSNPLSQFASTTSAQLAGVISNETGSGALVFAESPTLVTPALGTPASGVATNLTGTASGLTAGNVSTNANLTGHITSSGNAAVLGSFTSAQLKAALTNETGTGAACFATSPTLVTPTLGTPASGTLTNCTFPTLNQSTTGNAATVTTNANLTGHITSSGNATTLGSFSSANLKAALSDETGSGAAVFATSPTFVTPALGTPASGTLTNCTFPTLNQSTTGNATTATTATNVAGGAGGSVPYQSSANTTVLLANGSDGQILTSTGGTSAPAWENPAGGGDALTSGSLSQFAATTSAQLRGVLSDETGSGAAVFATSPTLVTPALGTPASGTLTNCSFPTLNQSTTGNAATVTTNANLTGHITSSGNAAVLGSFSSAQLKAALSDETGSGAAVFGTSPTLVTPALGTPASGTLTNCSFPTLNQNTTGSAATLTTARTIGGVSFNGSANINLPGVNTAGNQNTSGTAAGLSATLAVGSGGTGRTSGPGKVLQVLSANMTSAYTTTSTSIVNPTGLNIAITPSATSSKVLIMATVNMAVSGDGGHAFGYLLQDGGIRVQGDAAGSRPRVHVVQNNFGGNSPPTFTMIALTSPASTSALTFSVGVESSNGTTVYVNRAVRDNDGGDYDARSASTITVMEIAG